MIVIKTNPNFREWLDIRLCGKLIDNARNTAQAIQIAHTIQRKEQAKGNRFPIVQKKEVKAW